MLIIISHLCVIGTAINEHFSIICLTRAHSSLSITFIQTSTVNNGSSLGVSKLVVSSLDFHLDYYVHQFHLLQFCHNAGSCCCLFYAFIFYWVLCLMPLIHSDCFFTAWRCFMKNVVKLRVR